ncbi:CDCA2 protein, partial [Chauna torquata]|nr:CDCA2 protein [Chauna torquata]
MHRRSKIINATLEVKGNESRNTEEKEETSFCNLSKDQRICKVTESKVIMLSEKENLSDGNQARLQKRALKYTKDLEKESYHNKKDVVSCQLAECFFDTLKEDTVGEPTWPLNSKEKFSASRPVSLGDECYLPPSRDKADEKSYCGISEKQRRRRKTVDFATVTTAEFGITESFTNPSIGKAGVINSPTALKFRRRSAIGVRGSPENNALIQYLAQQRSNRQKEAFTQQASPFKFARSLKNKIDVFQTSFKSVQEAEWKTGFSELSQVSDASRAAGSENEVPFTKEHSLDQQSEKSVSDYSGSDLEENLKQNLTNGNMSDTKICTILSSHQDATVTEPPAISKVLVRVCAKKTNSTAKLPCKNFVPDRVSKEVRSNVTSDLCRKKVTFAEELSLEVHDESKPPITPLQMGNTSLNEYIQSGSQLRSVLKKTPVKQLMDCMKEYTSDTVDGGGGESLTVSDHVKICEALQTEKTERYSSQKPKKKKVTFGEDLSPEIFDKTLPANTPLHKGATPVRHPGSQSSSPFTRSRLIEEPLSQPNFDCSDVSLFKLQKQLLTVSTSKKQTYAPAHTRTPQQQLKIHVPQQCSTISEAIDFSISRATSTKNAKDTKNPGKNKLQRQKSITTSAAKKTQKIKHASSGKRRKRKVKKSLYGEREMASKKPLLSPIPEIPEVLSSASSPNSPKANALLPGNVFLDYSKSRNADKDVRQKQVIERMRQKNLPALQVYPSSKDLDIVEASSSDDTAFQLSDGDLKSVSGIDHKFPNIVPDTSYVLDTYDCFQQAQETICLKEEKESDFLIENEKLQGNFQNKEEWLTGLEFPDQQDTEVFQRTRCPPKNSSRGRPSKRRSSAVYIPPIEKFHFETVGNDLPVSSFNVEEILSAPLLKNNSEPVRRRNGNSSETSRVRRSMRLHKDAEIEGLAWIHVPNKILKNPPPLSSACKTRRTISTSVLTESENIHQREENLIQFAAPGKENNDSVNLPGPCKRWRRKSMCVSTPQERRTWSETQKRSIANPVYRKDRSNQRHSEEVE